MKKFLIILGLLFGVLGAVHAASEQFPEQWVLSKYVKDGKVDTGNPKALLNVRSGAGVNFDSIRTVKMGQPVVVYAKSGDWVRISPDVKKEAAKAAEKVVKKAPAKAAKEPSSEVPFTRYAIILTGLVALLAVLFVQSKN